MLVLDLIIFCVLHNFKNIHVFIFSQIIKLAYEKKSPKKNNSTNHQKINCFLNMWPSVKSSVSPAFLIALTINMTQEWASVWPFLVEADKYVWEYLWAPTATFFFPHHKWRSPSWSLPKYRDASRISSVICSVYLNACVTFQVLLTSLFPYL